jgi:hypothetical protein
MPANNVSLLSNTAKRIPMMTLAQVVKSLEMLTSVVMQHVSQVLPSVTFQLMEKQDINASNALKMMCLNVMSSRVRVIAQME